MLYVRKIGFLFKMFLFEDIGKIGKFSIDVNINMGICSVFDVVSGIEFFSFVVK